ncbi:MAG: acetyl-CoA carboxylase biotin carboxyl carrier protein [Gemmatimonadetes bacterium]|uniref:Biotin carboxyl carrier protein of acetyl-CoA carboxylase n=1 Tax=Candidatus Kutchimonas denitrificans TaxID=3056748 RepID=A0AAE4Z848_9BACT|nr:acetyl-CoA carboxylase biotin carboxyl carrier protein [Gemmatimonadota bacterium]NIR73926.1 acetyl-CoA carboxylase biotin carboxyl carrier protein [Candidatus Kutchimonas denitrificans]NIR99732.1 acetyl-CoA carboxylase biotin carboxyl carrier protein [Gemmatimonadota bacterium]NIT65317.1 acetyl-CoA carboxylase biotin carboxyl carrier protein [Gemmatimonadota bacterium]NIW73766.1 acetyl-CoA carboxylase biotin carboxyl carrier protein [Gemmatimonadota bacterium]
MDLKFLKQLIETVESSGIDTIEISRWATKIRISKSPTLFSSGGGANPTPVHIAPQLGNSGATNVPAQAPEKTEPVAPAEKAADLTEVTSPMVGTFYRAPAPDADPYVQVGDRVSVGQTLCILEAMKLMNELEAEVAGTIKEICVDNAEPVEYGQALFRILPD